MDNLNEQRIDYIIKFYKLKILNINIKIKNLNKIKKKLSHNQKKDYHR